MAWSCPVFWLESSCCCGTRKLDKVATNTPWDLYTYFRYVGDGNYVAEEAPLGMRYMRVKFVIKPELVEEDIYSKKSIAKNAKFSEIRLHLTSWYKLHICLVFKNTISMGW